ncbi:TniQ family protein [Endozoicomonas sp. SCSIO W0465]|uniref:TniQ family protein n=1 Tax=Endozoicomonas sp. SCSIO W0465 TaxID=2918516 RepID=UPI002074E608|nr:TniQ family protein [Endozoicomonas sp. SCSIO W0465]USE37044.1 TniQ family protein [Endozoicomonas sp. SCSIO W0465]
MDREIGCSPFLSRPKVFPDETLESYLIRVARSNSISLRSLIRFICLGIDGVEDSSVPGFDEFNLFHANLHPEIRYRGVDQLAARVGITSQSLRDITLSRSITKCSNNLSNFIYQNVKIPNTLYRRYFVPVCPACLAESGYIRQYWHVSINIICPTHKVFLIDKCPKCGVSISYIKNRSISNCSCGFDLKKATSTSLSINLEYDLLLETSSLIAHAFNKGIVFESEKLSCLGSNVFHLFCFALFYFRYIDDGNSISEYGVDSDKILAFHDFLRDWPVAYKDFLENKVIKG